MEMHGQLPTAAAATCAATRPTVHACCTQVDTQLHTAGHRWTQVDTGGHRWTQLAGHRWTQVDTGGHSWLDTGGHSWLDTGGHRWTQLAGHRWTQVDTGVHPCGREQQHALPLPLPHACMHVCMHALLPCMHACIVPGPRAQPCRRAAPHPAAYRMPLCPAPAQPVARPGYTAAHHRLRCSAACMHMHILTYACPDARCVVKVATHGHGQLDGVLAHRCSRSTTYCASHDP
jgi:hypothetical protein